VAADAICPEQTGMNGRFFMASGTFRGRSGNNLGGMASITRCFGMGAIQGKEIVMVEGVDEGVTAVVTGKTIFAK
jgi:hypothetical protein